MTDTVTARQGRIDKYLSDESAARERLASFPDAVRERLTNWQQGQSEWFSATLLEIVAEFIAFDDEAFTRTAHSGEGRDFQSEVGKWMLACFGEEIAADKIERADRFVEEALELAQTIPGFTVERARALVEYVFGRPVGERGQEVGGVGVTLAALCNTYDLNIAAEWERELARVWTKVEAIRAKQATKPVGSALPVAASGEGRSNGAGEAVTIPADHLLAKSLRTSQKALDEINRQEQANIAGYLALRDFPVGSTSAPFPPDEVGPNKLGTDWQDIAAQLREIRRISNDYDLREAIEGHDSGVGDSGIWRDLMDQCERLATLSAPQGEVERLREALSDLWGIVHGCDLRLSVSMETIAKVRAALTQYEGAKSD